MRASKNVKHTNQFGFIEVEDKNPEENNRGFSQVRKAVCCPPT
jgi:hypothetical protein